MVAISAVTSAPARIKFRSIMAVLLVIAAEEGWTDVNDFSSRKSARNALSPAARAASGHTAAPPRRVMKSRRFMQFLTRAWERNAPPQWNYWQCTTPGHAGLGPI